MEVLDRSKDGICEMSSENYFLSKGHSSKGYLHAWDQPIHEFKPEKYVLDKITHSNKSDGINVFDFDNLLIELSTIDYKAILPIELNEIKEEIEYSKEILNLNDDWDGNGAQAISEKVYNLGIEFIFKYSNFIYHELGVAIDSPEINPGRNGNLYLSWRTKHSRLAISIEENEEGEVIANYYGDLKNNKQPIKGNVTVGEIAEYLAYWMKNLR